MFTQTFGGTTFLTHSTIGGDAMSALDSSYFGVQFGWGGNRSTPQYAANFPDNDDARNMFFLDGQTLDFTEDAQLGQFVVGWPSFTIMELNLSVTKPACFENWLTMIKAYN